MLLNYRLKKNKRKRRKDLATFQMDAKISQKSVCEIQRATHSKTMHLTFT